MLSLPAPTYRDSRETTIVTDRIGRHDIVEHREPGRTWWSVGHDACYLTTRHPSRHAAIVAARPNPYGNRRECARPCQDRGIAQVKRSLDARQILADRQLREAIAATAKAGKTFSRSGCLDGLRLDAVREAVAVMRTRLARRAAAVVTSAVGGRIFAEQAIRREKRAIAVVQTVAHILHGVRPLYTSQYAGINTGPATDEVEWDRYSKRVKYPCKYSNAGAYVHRGLMIVEDSRGRVVWDKPIEPADWQPGEPRSRALRILGYVPAHVLDRIGPSGEDDSVQIALPLRVCKSRDGLIIADHPTAPRIVQVVVRDSTTGHRHHLTVPERFGLPLAADESATGRVRAAIAWTFRLKPEQYRPTVTA